MYAHARPRLFENLTWPMCGMKVGNWLTHSEVPTIRRPRWLLPALLTFCHFLRNARQPSTETSMQFPFRLRILTYLINARRNELARRRAKLIEILGKCFCSEERKKKFEGEASDWPDAATDPFRKLPHPARSSASRGIRGWFSATARRGGRGGP